MRSASKLSTLFTTGIAAACAVTFCSAAPTPALAANVTIKGSDTMVVLVQRWAEAFMKGNAGTVLQVTGGGSGTGISALINGTTDVCISSRAMKAAEKEQAKARHANPPEEIAVAKDGLSIYVHASNPLEEITLDQLKAIFTGKVTNWKELGLPEAKIVPYTRENSSGTYAYFREEVLKNGDFSPRAQALPGTAAVVNAVSKEKWSIGYGGAAYAKNIKILKVKKDAASPGVAPSNETVQAGTYPLSRPLFFYLKGKPSGDIKKFIDYVLSPEGQSMVEKVGYYAIQQPKS